MDGLQNCRTRNETETLLAEKMGFPETIRLACQTRIKGVISDVVNTASRIEGANKDFGTKLLISQSGKEKIDGLITSGKMHLARLKGLSAEHRLYEIEI